MDSVSKTKVKDKLKKLSKYAKNRGMVKDYGDIASTYMTHVKYLARPEDFDELNNKVRKAKRCLMCKSRPCKMVFFPCRHACVCNECMKEHNIGTKDTREQTAWRACPLCMEEIKIVLPRDGHEETKYWEWVHDVKPPIPSAKSFVKQFRKVGDILEDNNKRQKILDQHNLEITSTYSRSHDSHDQSDTEYTDSDIESSKSGEETFFWHIKEEQPSSSCCLIV
eukprot:g1470.t1